ncbi:MAG TPA: C25 family cysteine peptidase, partial [Candidatus Syntrophosphaera sp.]|nr:C25 family cysteine peptidase [Candidatus Syntrophosphaera sp.]
GAHTLGLPGQPALPWIGIRLLLPVGTRAKELRIERLGERRSWLETPLAPIQSQYPISLPEAAVLTPPDPSIYSANAVFPDIPHTGVTTQYLSGHPVCFSAVCPFDYNPASGELVSYERIRIVVETAPDPTSPASRGLLREDVHTRQQLLRSVDNPDAVPRYTLPSQGYDYIIIHDAAKYSQWLPLKALYDARGYNVLMQSVQDIYSQFTGATNPEKIRNYLSAMYVDNTIRYVFLAGDIDAIPHKGLYANAGNYVSNNIPADIYYASLDGSWNTDGDIYWGEQGEADLVPEFAIGRFCYNNDTEIANFIAKLTDYLNAPETGELRRYLLLGEQLNTDPTWGGDYMDELIGGSSANSYATVGFPPDWSFATLYDRDAAWGINQLKPLISDGYNFVNHLGHGSVNSTLGVNIGDVTATNFTNDGDGENFSLVYSQACNSGGFDTSDCISEKFMSLPTATVAMISNSRYGWYAPSSTNGSSQHFHREYIDSYFGEQIPGIGDALNDSKIDIIPFTLSSGVMHWVHYELNLMGDPAMLAWTDTPANFSAQLPDAWISGLDHYQFATNAPRANIRIKNGAEFLYEGFADADGLVYIHLDRVIAPGIYDLYINAPNVFAWHTQITFEAAAGAYLSCLPVVFHDADGLHHSGEQLPLTVTLRNTGQAAQLTGGTLTLSCASPNIQIISGSYNFPALAAGDSLVIADVYQIGIQGEFSDLSAVQFLLTASYDSSQTESHAWLTLNAPALQLTNYQAENPILHIHPGDNPTFSLAFSNRGSGNAYYPVLDLQCASPHAQLSAPQVSLPALEHGTEQTLEAVFGVAVSPLAPLNEAIVISYSLGAENGADSQGEFRLYVSDSGYHFENNLLGFSVADLDPEFTNQWHRDAQRNFTPNGSYAMKFGGPGAEYYESKSYGALVSPAFTLGLNSKLKFRHWMQSEVDSDTLQAWDGGLLQMSLDGGEWFQITPTGGYPCTIIDNPDCPLAAGTPVWSGSFDWTEAVFDLSAYSGSASFRWIFGSDGALNFEGWYVDEIELAFDLPAAPQMPQNLVAAHTGSGCLLSWTPVSEDVENQALTPLGYNVYRASEPGGELVFLAFSPDPYFLDADPSARAFYRVTAVRPDR